MEKLEICFSSYVSLTVTRLCSPCHLFLGARLFQNDFSRDYSTLSEVPSEHNFSLLLSFRKTHRFGTRKGGDGQVAT